MINEYYDFLSNADPINVKLYFIKRNKNSNTKEIIYNVFKSIITEDIGYELITIGSDQIKPLMGTDVDILDYDILPYSEKKCLEKISFLDVPYLKSIILSASNPGIDIVSEIEFHKIWGYMVIIEDDDQTLFLFRNYSPKRLLEKGTLKFLYGDGHFQKLEHDVMSIDRSYDCGILFKESIDFQTMEPQNILIFRKTQFEYLFSFDDFYRQEVEKTKNILTQKRLFSDVDTLLEYCSGNSKMSRKLSRLVKNGYVDHIDHRKLPDFVEKYGLDLSFDSDGRIIVEKDKMWVF